MPLILGRTPFRHAAAAAFALVALALLPAVASAAEPPPVLWTAGQNCEVLNEGGKSCITPKPAGEAGTTNIPRGIVADPANGQIYVADQGNNRIDEFDAWGQFIHAFGWNVAPEGAPGDTAGDELEVCTTVCQTGVRGHAAGQLAGPQGLAIDSEGDLYASESPCCGGNYRVQKFDLSGPLPTFAWAIGTGVDQGPNHPGDLCTVQYVAEGDICVAGSEGTSPGQFSGWPISSFIAIGPDDTLYVGDKNRIEEFEPSGAYKTSIEFTGGGAIGEAPEPGQVSGLAADQEGGKLYFSYESAFNSIKAEAEQPDVFKLDPATGKVTGILPIDNPGVLATDTTGHVFVLDKRIFEPGQDPRYHPHQILEFDPAGARTAVFGNEELGSSSPPTGLASGSACNTTDADIYASGSALSSNSYLRAWGQPPDKLDGEGNPLCPAPLKPPRIDAQEVTGATPTSTTVQAQINPRFWPDATYYVEWGTGKCSEGDCTHQSPASPAELGGGIVEKDVSTAAVTLEGLEPSKTYHYRFVAESSGGGPVYGVDPDESGPQEAIFAQGEEGEFLTFPATEAGPETGCANEAFRSGAAAFLPDCRTWEQVSPVEKGGFDAGSRVIARADGEAAIYASLGAFADADAGAYPSTYLATRGAGWLSSGLEPPFEPALGTMTPVVLGTSGDFSKQLVATSAKLTPEAVGGDNAALNFYVRDPTTGTYQYAGTAYGRKTAIPALALVLLDMEFVGSAENGSIFYFGVPSVEFPFKAPGGSTANNEQSVYAFDTASGTLHDVGSFPDGTLTSSFKPTPKFIETGRAGFHAVSADGSRVYWTPQPGAPLYLRVNPTAEESARLHGAATGKGDATGPAEGTGTAANASGGTIGTVSNLSLKSGSFIAGQEVSDSAGKVKAGTTITKVEETSPGVFKLTLSQTLSGAAAGDTITGKASEVLRNVATETGAFQPGQEISGEGIPAGATVVSCAPDCGAEATSLTLSAKASATKVQAHLSATSPCTEAATKACAYLVSRRFDGSAQNATFWGASSDGSRAFLTSKGKLTEDASPAGTDLYRYDAETQQLIDLTPDASDVEGADVRKVLGVSEDGAFAYFIATGNLAPGASDTDPKIYAWHEGQLRFVSDLASEPNELTADQEAANNRWRVSPDGRYLGFLFGGRLTGPHPQRPWAYMQAYLYDYEADSLTCASCPPGGYTSGDVAMGIGVPTQSITASSFAGYQSGRSRNVTDAGQFFFETPDRLLLRDTNGVQDVYEYSADHRVHLISSGQDPNPSYFGDASSDGSNAFFGTRQSLVGQDTDPFYDLYDARVGGGIAAQSPAISGGCEGDGCQGEFTREPTGQPGPGTSAFQGPGNPAPRHKKHHRKHKKHHGKHRHHRHRPAGNGGRTR